jgi:crossover junction endodeoxyribonuclease RuvC
VRILGIDPGTLRLGYGVVDVAFARRDRLAPGRMTYVECGVISAPRSGDRTARLLTIGRGLRDLVTELRPDAAAIEEAFFGKSVQAMLALGEARGVALFVAAECGLPVTGYAPARIKSTVVGHGGAGKEQVGFLVRALLGLRRTPALDAADALAIAICHARLGALAARYALRSARPS